MPPKQTIVKSSGKKKNVQPGPIPRPAGVATVADVKRMPKEDVVAFFASMVGMSHDDQVRIICAIVNDKTGVPRGRSDGSDIEYLNRADGDVLVYIRDKIRNEGTWITKNVGDDTTITRKVVTTHVAVHVSNEFPDIYNSGTAGLFAGRYADVVVKKVKQLAVLAGIPAEGVVKHAAKDGPEWADLLNHAKGTGFAWCKQIEPIVKHVLGMDSIEKMHELNTIDGIAGLPVANTSGGGGGSSTDSLTEGVPVTEAAMHVDAAASDDDKASDDDNETGAADAHVARKVARGSDSDDDDDVAVGRRAT